MKLSRWRAGWDRDIADVPVSGAPPSASGEDLWRTTDRRSPGGRIYVAASSLDKHYHLIASAHRGLRHCGRRVDMNSAADSAFVLDTTGEGRGDQRYSWRRIYGLPRRYATTVGSGVRLAQRTPDTSSRRTSLLYCNDKPLPGHCMVVHRAARQHRVFGAAARSPSVDMSDYPGLITAIRSCRPGMTSLTDTCHLADRSRQLARRGRSIFTDPAAIFTTSPSLSITPPR